MKTTDRDQSRQEILEILYTLSCKLDKEKETLPGTQVLYVNRDDEYAVWIDNTSKLLGTVWLELEKIELGDE